MATVSFSRGVPLLTLLLLFSSRVETQTLEDDDIPQSPEEAVEQCEKGPWKAVYSNIKNDLKHWAKNGISLELMNATIANYSLVGKGHYKAPAFLIQDGKPYVIGNMSLLEKTGHHAGLITAHAVLIKRLTQRFGDKIPNVEFVVGTSDEPSVRLDFTKGYPIPPVFRSVVSTCLHAAWLGWSAVCKHGDVRDAWQIWPGSALMNHAHYAHYAHNA